MPFLFAATCIPYCQNGGTCGNTPNSCVCPNGYLGARCEFGKSIDLNVRTTLYSVRNSTTREHCSVAFICMVTHWVFIHGLELQCAVLIIKQRHGRVLLSAWLSFVGSLFRISSIDSKATTTLYSIIESTTREQCSVAFI